MATSWRTMWQKWKKDNPDFDKLRVKTVDLGPLMDDIQHEIAALSRDTKTLDKNFRELEAIKRKLEQGLTQYRRDYAEAVKRQFPDHAANLADEREKVKAARNKYAQHFDQKYQELIKLVNDRGLWRDSGEIPRLGKFNV